jgi:ribosomal protein S18 acetylase RimI-like enzyme
MNYGKCDPKNHNLGDIAKLVYSTEPELSMMLFGKNEKKATRRIIKLIQNKSSSFSYKNIILAYKNNRVLGIIVGFCGSETDDAKDKKAISESLDFIGILRLSFYDKLLLSRILTTAIAPNDYYINVICVNKDFRRKGIGENLIKNAEIIAKKKKCKRIILDVSQDNDLGIKFYKKNGFRIYDKVNFRLFFQDINTYKMELIL